MKVLSQSLCCCCCCRFFWLIHRSIRISRNKTTQQQQQSFFLFFIESFFTVDETKRNIKVFLVEAAAEAASASVLVGEYQNC